MSTPLTMNLWQMVTELLGEYVALDEGYHPAVLQFFRSTTTRAAERLTPEDLSILQPRDDTPEMIAYALLDRVRNEFLYPLLVAERDRQIAAEVAALRSHMDATMAARAEERESIARRTRLLREATDT